MLYKLFTYLHTYFSFVTVYGPRCNVYTAIGCTDDINTAAEIASPPLNSATPTPCKRDISAICGHLPCIGHISGAHAQKW